MKVFFSMADSILWSYSCSSSRKLLSADSLIWLLCERERQQSFYCIVNTLQVWRQKRTIVCLSIALWGAEESCFRAQHNWIGAAWYVREAKTKSCHWRHKAVVFVGRDRGPFWSAHQLIRVSLKGSLLHLAVSHFTLTFCCFVFLLFHQIVQRACSDSCSKRWTINMCLSFVKMFIFAFEWAGPLLPGAVLSQLFGAVYVAGACSEMTTSKCPPLLTEEIGRICPTRYKSAGCGRQFARFTVAVDESENEE